MIRKILTTYAARLDEYLARSHRQPEGVAEVGLIGSAGEQCPNKLVLRRASLLRRRGRSRVQLLAPGEGTARRVWFWVRQAAYYRKK